MMSVPMVHAVRRMCVVCRMLRVNIWYGARRRIPAFDCLPYASGFRQLISNLGCMVSRLGCSWDDLPNRPKDGIALVHVCV